MTTKSFVNNREGNRFPFGNPPIPVRPCFRCGKLTDETHSRFGVGHYHCYSAALTEQAALMMAAIANPERTI